MHRARRTLAAVAVLSLLTACSDDDDGGRDAGDRDAAPAAVTLPTALLGWVVAGGPVEGATVTAVDDDGETIATAEEPSLATGTWHLPLDDPPDRFTLVATGGTEGGQPFDGELRAVVEDYAHETPGAIHLNPATTLVAAHLDSHADASYEVAVEAVHDFLGLPASHDLESDLRATDDWFSGAAFLQEAADAGGVGELVDALVDELDAGEHHAFPPPPSNQDAEEAAELAESAATSSFTPMSLLQGAVGLGSMINGIIRGGQQTDALKTIQTELSGVETELSTIEGKLDQILTTAQQSAYNGSFSASTNTLASLMTNGSESDPEKQAGLTGIFGMYQLLMQSAGGSGVAQAQQAFAASIYNGGSIDHRALIKGTDAGGGLDGIYNDLTKVGGETGGLQTWTAMKGTASNRFITNATAKDAAYAIRYWVGLQTQVLHVKIAYEMIVDPTSDTTTSTTSPYGPPYDMNSDVDLLNYAGPDNVTAVASQCRIGGSANTGNKLLDEFNVSNACFELIPGGDGEDMYLIDQTTNLMWTYDGDYSGDWYSDAQSTKDEQDPGDYLPDGVAPEAQWRLPSLAELEHLATYQAGSWSPAPTPAFKSPLDFLARYAQVYYPFGGLLDDVADTNLSQPDDYVTRFWSSTTETASGEHTRDGGTPTTPLYASYDFLTASVKWNCPTKDDSDPCWAYADPNNGNDYWSPAPDSMSEADWLWVRAVPAGEGPYGSP